MASDSGSVENKDSGGIDADENIWKQLLKHAEKGTTSSSAPYESSLLIVGEAGNGKSSILAKWKDRITLDTKIPEYILDYSYINVSNKYDSDKDAILSRMNVWQLDDSEHAGILPGLMGDLSKAAFVITLDFSKPATILDTLLKWLDIFKKTCEGCLSKASAEDQKALKKKVSKYVQFFVDINKAEEKEETKETTEESGAPKTEDGEKKETTEALAPTERSSLVMEVDPDIPKENYGVPLFVVGLKADFFEKVVASTDDGEEKFDFISQRLRKICLDWGATLIYTSAVGDGTNVTELHDQVFHRVFGFPLKHKTKAVGNCSDYGIHVPAGFDSLGIIEAAGSGSSRWSDETPLSDVFVDKQEKKKNAKTEVRVEAKTDQEFFGSLKKQLDSGRPDTGSRSPVKDNKKKKEKAVKNFFKGLLSGENQSQTKGKKGKRRQGNRKS